MIGVNAERDSGEEQIINNASCTTNCIAPVAAVMHSKFGIAKALMTTVHSYTADQNLQDAPHKDLRRARAAAENIVPTSTGAAIAVTRIIPELEGKFDGVAFRSPTITGSAANITFLAKKKTTVEEINKILKDAAKEKRWQGIMAVTEEQLVSSDIIGSPYGAIVDLKMTKVIDGDLVNILSWYDNEYGYVATLIKHAEQIISVL